MSGFIAMQRDAFEHPLLRDGDRFRAWFWLVANAAWKPTTTRIKGQTVELGRGELSFAQRFLAEKWGMSKSRVDRFLSDLRAEGMIETRTKIGATAGHSAGQGQSIITICNYEKYQDPINGERGNTRDKDGATAGQQRGKEEQGNNNNKNRASKIPADWRPEEFGPNSKSKRIVDGWSDDELETHIEAFIGHHVKTGKVFQCWQAAWSTWVLNSEKFKPKAAANDYRKPTGTATAAQRAIASLGG